MDTEEIEHDIELISEWPVTQDAEPLFKGSFKADKNLQDKPNGAEVDSKRSIDNSNEFMKRSSNYKRSIEVPILDFQLKRRKYSGEKENLANTALAKWWRRNQSQCGTEDTAAVKGCHPHTLIKMIARSPAGKQFISDEIQRLRKQLIQGSALADVHAALGSFLEKQGDIIEAIYHLENAVKGDPDEKEYKWLLQKLKRILKIKTIQEEGLQRVQPGVEFPSNKQVERRSANDLTVEDFYHNYECTSTPVIITNVQMTRVPWTLNHVKEIAGNCTVTLKKPVKQSVEWARLENSLTVQVSTYINQIINNKMDDPLYLFDWSLPINCPPLAEELTIPKYFAGDFLQRTKEGSLYKDSWPSLFVAPEGITSELHVDAFGSNFWMALFQGKKRWVFFPQSDVPYLYPEYEHSLDPVFAVDLSKPDLTRYPLLQLTTPMECVLEPGDVLFVPAGCPHRVENLETSVAISSNFVDQSNLNLVRQELKINALIDIRSEELLQQFNDENFNDKMDLHIQDKVFCKYKYVKN
ncbi:JMJD6 [Mytilus coruscus]|uniref:JMJD6 n=1 Tax=Mytilus coruscus TaxID=42192 RepID=A0A6J8EX94_MYTCO|nr:JMJD6 [Mytilus coruscus]